MDNYRKGKVNEPDELMPFTELPDNCIIINIKENSNTRNMVNHGFNALKSNDQRSIIITGHGSASCKAVTCCEILKRRWRDGLHQITKINYKRFEEFWEPNTKEMDTLKVIRDIPAIYILLSKDQIKQDQLNYQPPHKTPLLSKQDHRRKKKPKDNSNT